MRMSTKGKYGLRAVLEIAASGVCPMSVASIARSQNISESYLEQLMRGLKKAGIVEAARGVNGGYTLGREPSEITVDDVLEAVGEAVEPVECAGLRQNGICETVDVCRSKMAWKKLNDGVRHLLQGMTLASLLEETKDDARVTFRDV